MGVIILLYTWYTEPDVFMYSRNQTLNAFQYYFFQLSVKVSSMFMLIFITIRHLERDIFE